MDMLIVYSIPGIVAFFVGLFLLLFSARKTPQLLLVVTLMVYAVAQCSYAQYYNPHLQDMAIFDPVYSVFMLMVPSFFCLFISSLTYPEMTFRKGWLFFLPVFVFSAFYFGVMANMTKVDYQFYSSHILRGVEYSGYMTLPVKWMYAVGFFGFRLLCVTMMGLTMYASAVRIQKYSKLVRNYDSKLYDKVDVPRKLVLHFICGFFPLWIIQTAPPNYRATLPFAIVIASATTIILVMAGFLGRKISFSSVDLKRIFKEADRHYDFRNQDVLVEMERPSVQVNVFDSVSEQLAKVMEEEKLFLDPDINIITLATRLGTNRHYLVKVLDVLYGKSFYEYIRNMRISYSKKLMMERGDATVDCAALARECGYDSEAPFIAEFKSLNDVTPEVWLSRRKAGLY